VNEALPLVAEYVQRSMLRKLGFTSSADDLSIFDVEAFSVISDEIARLEKEEMKKARK